MPEQAFRSIDCVEKDNGRRFEIDVVVASEAIDEAIDEFYALMFQLKQVDAANPGEAKERLEGSVGKENLEEACRDYVLNKFTTLAIRHVAIDHVLAPGVHADDYPAKGCDFSYAINLTARPNLSLSSIEPVRIEKKRIDVEEGDIQEQLAYTARQFVSYRTLGREVLEENDFALMDVDMAVEGKPLKKLSGAKRLVEVRRGPVPAGFVEGVCGMQVGETRSFDFQVPGMLGTKAEAYSAKVTLREVQEEVIPPIDDEFVARYLPQFGTLAEFRNSIRHDLESQKARVEQQDLAVSIREALEKRLQGTIPDEMYEEAKESLLNSVVKKIESQDSTLEEYCEEHGIAEDAFNMNVFMQASGYLRQNLALDILAKERGLVETEEDVHKAKAGLKQTFADLSDEEFEQRGLRRALGEQIRREKAMRWLAETAVIAE